VHGPLPADGKAEARSRIADVWDKGKAAVIVQESTVTTPAGDPLWTTTSSIFARGEGGFGGSRGPSGRLPAPEGDPVLEVEVPTLPQQALLYRLCGDRNPLHADPAFAALAGFDRPILHGLCTYGVVCKALADNLLAGDVTKVATFGTRFAGVLFPGETLRVRAWQTEAGYQATATAVDRDDAPVLDETVLTVR
jgi:acyl dehydratase